MYILSWNPISTYALTVKELGINEFIESFDK